MATTNDYYDILGLKKGATKADIKSAYRKMALKYHPDKNKASDAESKFKEINEAYSVLSDDQKKSAYDQFGHAGVNGGAGGGNPFAGGFGSQQGPFTWSYNSSSGGANPFAEAGFDDAFDIFNQFFGGGMGQAQRRSQYRLSVDFMDAAKGGEQTVEIEGKKHKIKIPAGANTGTRLRFDNFDIIFEVEAHPDFKRDGYDIFVDKKISFATAALGGEISVPTLDKPIKMKIRGGTQSHTLMRIRGEGIPMLRGKGKGDLYVRMIVEVPEKLSGEQKRLLKELENLEN